MSRSKPDSPAYRAVAGRRSYSKVTDTAPDAAELEHLIAAASRAADHGAMHPWRVIALRGKSRAKLGNSLAKAAKLSGSDADSLAAKPLRAPLLLAIVLKPKPSGKVPEWEQEAVASGVAHLLSLLLHDAGWGVIWRTGPYTRHKKVAKMHGLEKGEKLLGWLYVGGIPDRAGSSHDKKLSGKKYLTTLD